MKRLKHKSVRKSKFYKVKDGRIERSGRICPRCGEGIWMAEHKQKGGKTRYYCGQCHMTIWE